MLLRHHWAEGGSRRVGRNSHPPVAPTMSSAAVAVSAPHAAAAAPAAPSPCVVQISRNGVSGTDSRAASRHGSESRRTGSISSWHVELLPCRSHLLANCLAGRTAVTAGAQQAVCHPLNCRVSRVTSEHCAFNDAIFAGDDRAFCKCVLHSARLATGGARVSLADCDASAAEDWAGRLRWVGVCSVDGSWGERERSRCRKACATRRAVPDGGVGDGLGPVGCSARRVVASGSGGGGGGACDAHAALHEPAMVWGVSDVRIDESVRLDEPWGAGACDVAPSSGGAVLSIELGGDGVDGDGGSGSSWVRGEGEARCSRVR